jgi:hypothetical protein
MRAAPVFARVPIVAALCLAAIASAGATEPEAAVWLSSGRQFRGIVDPASSQERLILRKEQSGITIRRPIAWESIERVQIDGRPEPVTAWRQSLPAMSPPGTRAVKIELRGSATKTIPSPAAPLPPPPPPATSLSFYASIANWDADVETDGLIVELMPITSQGAMTPVSGTVEVELWAAQRQPALDLAPRSGGATIELVERWTRAVSVADFGTSGAVLKLPFGAVHPEIDASWPASTYGLVHVKLTVPGQGVLEASRDGISIRPFSPLRDRLERKGENRFLPTERVGRRG